MNPTKYAALRWIARYMPWTWRHVVPPSPRRAWVLAAADQDGLAAIARLDRITRKP